MVLVGNASLIFGRRSYTTTVPGVKIKVKVGGSNAYPGDILVRTHLSKAEFVDDLPESLRKVVDNLPLTFGW